MSALAEATELIQAIGSGAGTVGAQRRKAWMAVAKLSSDFTWNRICDLHRGRQATRVSGDELKVLRAAARQQEEAKVDGRIAYRDLIERVARLEARLFLVDQGSYRDGVSEMRQSVGVDGGDGCSMD